MKNQNITLSVPRQILRKFKEIAFRKQKSLSGLMVEMMESAIESEDGCRVAREQSLRRMEAGMNLGTGGNITWTRDDLHER